MEESCGGVHVYVGLRRIYVLWRSAQIERLNKIRVMLTYVWIEGLIWVILTSGWIEWFNKIRVMLTSVWIEGLIWVILTS